MSKLQNHPFQLLAITGAVALLVSACGGGGTASVVEPTPAGNTVTLSGSAATGLALGNATVAIKCATGSGSATTSSAGAYTVSLSNAALPCVLKVTSSDNSVTYHSVAAGSGGGTVVANITPLTELVVAQATGSSPAAFFAGFTSTSAQTQLVAASSLNAAVAAVAQALNSAVSIGSLNPLTGALTPATPSDLTGGNAYDQLLDQLQISIANAGTSLVALTTVAATGGGPTTLGSTLQSALAAATTDGFFEVYFDGSQWNLVDHHATGPAVNGVYNMQGLSHGFVNGAWSINRSDINDSHILGAGGWVNEPRQETATMTQTGSNVFSYRNTSGTALNFGIQPVDVSSINLADVDASLPSTTIPLPAGSKVFNFTTIRATDEYRLNGGTGFDNVASLAALRSFYANTGSAYLTWMGGDSMSATQLGWQFGPGTASGTLYLFNGVVPLCMMDCPTPVAEPALGSWEVITKNGVQIMVLTMPSSAGSNGLLAGQKYIYSMIPGGNAQEGRYSPAGTPDDSFRDYNRTAMNAILAAIGGLASVPN